MFLLKVRPKLSSSRSRDDGFIFTMIQTGVCLPFSPSTSLIYEIVQHNREALARFAQRGTGGVFGGARESKWKGLHSYPLHGMDGYSMVGTIKLTLLHTDLSFFS